MKDKITAWFKSHEKGVKRAVVGIVILIAILAILTGIFGTDYIPGISDD